MTLGGDAGSAPAASQPGQFLLPGGGGAPKRPAPDDPDTSSKAPRPAGVAPPARISISLGAKKPAPATAATSPPKPPVKAISMKLGSVSTRLLRLK